MQARFTYEAFKKELPKGLLTGTLVNPRTFEESALLKKLLFARALRGVDIDATIYETLKKYKEKFKELRKEGESASEAREEALNDEALLKTRILAALTYEAKKEFIDQFKDDELLVWLPSSAKRARHSHMLHYGKTYTKARMLELGWLDDWGCKCGAVLASTYNK